MVSYHAHHPKIEEDYFQLLQHVSLRLCISLRPKHLLHCERLVNTIFYCGTQDVCSDKEKEKWLPSAPLHHPQRVHCVLLQDSIAPDAMWLTARNATEIHRMPSICCLVLQLCVPPGLNFLAALSDTPHRITGTEAQLPGTMPIFSPFPHRGPTPLAPRWAFPGVLEQELRPSCRKDQAPESYGAVIPSRASEEIVNLHPKPPQFPVLLSLE